MGKCSNCGKEYSSEVKFCSECGGKIETQKKMFCTHCGNELNGGAFCIKCGHRVETEQQTEEKINEIIVQEPVNEPQPYVPYVSVPVTLTTDPTSYTVPDTYDANKYDSIVLDELDEKGEKKILGLQGAFLKGEKRKAMLTSKLVEKAIKDSGKNGQKIAKEEIDKIKFARDPVFKQKVIEKVHHDCDKEYYNNIKTCENQIKSLEKARSNEIKRIEESRWEFAAGKLFAYNLTEGKLMINNSVSLFSSIKGAGANIHESYRVVTEEKGQSKKRASVGGALAGGLMFGAVGAVVGGAALGKTKHTSTTNVNQIPTASHVGVVVNLDGFQNEILILNKTVDQDSREFQDAINKAQEIIAKLQYLAAVPVPKSYIRADQEQSVLSLQNQILEMVTALETAKDNIPKYEIPERYL